STSFTPHVDYGNIRAELDSRGIATPTARQLRDVIIDIRNAKLPDPKVEGNAGSFFMNPIVSREQFENIRREYPSMPFYEVRNGQGDCTAYKIPAGWMIDQCGWKGKTIGPAGVHSRQALVLVNKGGATGSDIVRLMKAVQHDVCERFGISLQPEVNIV
ncbi:MAG: UDP-N-acetylmuramate dehydrogenase, partial [Prevotella sp.]|nr:UDP-N-acetylmuramate dehydrogenase [Prevotella sp.]